METMRQIGKYVTIAACITAVAYGVINWKYFAPFEISVVCWVGLVIWITGAIGVRVQKAKARKGLPK